MRVGLLKPDHLGDLVLAAPAVAALRRRFADLTLFGHPQALPLAAHLFPGLRLRPLTLPHLDRSRALPADGPAPGEAGLREVDLLICLRWDRHVERLLGRLGVEFHASWLDVLDLHVAAEHRAVVEPFAGPYEVLESFAYPRRPPGCRPSDVAAVGLCVAAGFRLNAWPSCHWLGLAERLHRRGAEVVLIGGPDEAVRLRVLADACEGALGYRPRVLLGGADFGAFLEAVADAADLVVATDSGTAHLVSLVCPVVSLFGGSPWRRFAPLGRFNAVLSRRLACSPCRQFDRGSVNACVTPDCLANLFPDQVDRCLSAYLAGTDLTNEVQIDGVRMASAPWEGASARKPRSTSSADTSLPRTPCSRSASTRPSRHSADVT